MKVIANGIAQYYQRHGAGPPVVLIHALGLDHRLWHPQISSLETISTIYAYDARGHGMSDVPTGPYTLSDFAEDLSGLLDAHGIESAHLVGISMGGMIAQQFAVTWPARVRSLVLADTTSEYDDKARRLLSDRARLVESEGMTAVTELILARWFTEDYRVRNPESVDQIRGILLEADPSGYAAACRAVRAVDLTERLVTIEVPTLVLVGSEDTSTPPEMALRIHEYLPGSAYEEILGAAHLASFSHPEVFNDAIRRTVKRGEQALAPETE
jgi:3-oxoadipate enol-lactonase